MLILLLAVAAVVGYLAGRARLGYRVSNWAHRQLRPTGIRFATVYTIRSAENIGWRIAHPVQGWHAWRTRNDPPPPRSPAPTLVTPWPPGPPQRQAEQQPSVWVCTSYVGGHIRCDRCGGDLDEHVTEEPAR